MSADGNSVSGDGWKMAWGSALNSIPGSDEGLARKSPPDIGSMLNRKTPSGLTPLELLRAVLPSPEESELAQYKQDDHNCRTYQNHEACVHAANLKADLIDKGIDVNK